VHGRFSAPTPSAGEFRRLTSKALRDAMLAAGTTVCAPVSRIDLEVPIEALTSVLARLVSVGATPEPAVVDPVRARISGRMPTEEVDLFEQRLPGMTGGRGVFFSEPGGYEPVRGVPPTRRRRPVPG
jgi:ribosomal protection tetracycline resistance protein